jgi:endonuclease/exonuclease/phosphatase family metal-dependent hydrolase
MLRILTLNINGPGVKQGHWARRKELIARTIEQSGADICALQAVDQPENTPDQARQLAELLPRFTDVACEWATDGTGPALGSAFLSQVPFAEVKPVRLSRRPGTEDPFERILFHGRFSLPGGPLDLFNAHFSWVEEQAADHVREVLHYLADISGLRVIVGDMNQIAEAEPMLRLCEAGWEDVWPKLRPEQSGYTFEAGQLTKRIDYVWVPQDVLSRVRSIELIGDMVEGGVRLSDHLGLVATLEP